MVFSPINVNSKIIINHPIIFCMMNERERIEKDVLLFEKNLLGFETNDEKETSVVELAQQYYEDAKYYLGKNDLFTAFGCINYAHGLLDALIKTR